MEVVVRGSLEQHSQSYNHIIDARVSKSSGPRCEIVGIVSHRLSVYPCLYTCVQRRTCTCTCWLSTRASHGYCDGGTRACFLKLLQHMMGLAQAISVSGKVVSSAQHNLPLLAMSRYTLDCGKASSWYAKG